VLALYFPQFHAFPVNSLLWGANYTDFVAVSRVDSPSRHGFPVVRPRGGFYDGLLRATRARQAAEARAAGVYGFVYYHYWFSGGPVMDGTLEALLADGEPNLPFAISWANENWSRNWDGGQREVIIEQRYEHGDWRIHFDWLLRFFRHPRYIRTARGLPLLFIYRVGDVQGLGPMLHAWRAWALEAGLPGLHVVQTNGNEWAPGALQMQPGVDGVAEFFPNLYRSTTLRPLRELLAMEPEAFGVRRGTGGAGAGAAGGGGGVWGSPPPGGGSGGGFPAPAAPPEAYLHGVHAAFNNKPRHATDGRETAHPYHPVSLRAALGAQLRRTPRGGYVLLNAWNEWGEGCVVEPSEEFGEGWLAAIAGALRDASAGGPGAPLVPRVGSGLPAPPPPRAALATAAAAAAPAPTFCFALPVDAGDGAEASFFSLARALNALQRLDLGDWVAYVADAGAVGGRAPYPALAELIAARGDPRIRFVGGEGSAALRALRARGGASAAAVGDALLAERCVGEARAAWVALASARDWYAPDALNDLPEGADVVLLHAHSARTEDAALGPLGAEPDGACCDRLARYACGDGRGGEEVGALLVRGSALRRGGLSFEALAGGCGAEGGGACAARGALAALEAVAAPPLRVHRHPPGACALLHGPSAASCALGGALYHDAGAQRASCFEAHAFPLPLGDVDWRKFVRPGGCACAKT
jgi:hypothetical protein